MTEKKQKLSISGLLTPVQKMQIGIIKAALKGRFLLKCLIAFILYSLITGVVVNVNWLINLFIK